MLWALLALLSALLFALAGLLYRKATSGSNLHPLAASGLRAGPAFLAMLAAAGVSGGSLAKPAEFYLYATLSAALAFFVGDSFFIYGLSRAPVGSVYPVAYTFPIFVAAFTFALTGRAPSPTSLAAAALAALGVWLVYSSRVFSPLGALAGLAASVNWGLSISLASLALRYSSPVEFNLYRTGLLLVASAPAVLRERPRLRSARLEWLLLGGFLGIGLGPLALFASIELSGAVGPSVVASGAPVFAVLLASPVLGEKPDARALLGAALVAAAIALVSLWG